jgi:hypothetical protein
MEEHGTIVVLAGSAGQKKKVDAMTGWVYEIWV